MALDRTAYAAHLATLDDEALYAEFVERETATYSNGAPIPPRGSPTR